MEKEKLSPITIITFLLPMGVVRISSCLAKPSVSAKHYECSRIAPGANVAFQGVTGFFPWLARSCSEFLTAQGKQHPIPVRLRV